jgi:hypothetical protein
MLMRFTGISEERAFSMRRDERIAWIVVVGQTEGQEWDWGMMRWKARERDQ